jgi:hypothetical protein
LLLAGVSGAKGLEWVGAVMLAAAGLLVWAMASHYFLRVRLHNGSLVEPKSKDRKYLEKALQSSAMS